MVRIGARTSSRSYDALDTDVNDDGGNDSSDETKKMSNGSNDDSSDSSDDSIEAKQNPLKRVISEKMRQTSSFIGKRNRKVPSYRLSTKRGVGGRGSKQAKNRHNRLPTSEEEAQRIEHSSSDMSNDEENKLNISKSFTKRKSVNRKKHLEATESGMEENTDAEYGIVSYSYTSSNPSSVDYEPRSLQKMKMKIDRGNPERRRRYIFNWILVAVGLSLFIIIMAIVSGNKDHNMIPEIPPSNLEQICSISNLATEAGFNQCAHECEGGKCCMASGKGSCFQEQEETCGLYSPCGTIHSGIDNGDDNYVPPAPDDLGSICSKGSIAVLSGFIHCQSLCHAGLCCYDDDTVEGAHALQPCTKTHADVCDSYLPCENLKNKDEGINHGTSVELVKEKCTALNVMNKQGKEDCENLCQARSCCFTQSPSKNCYADNKVWCSEFDACEVLIGSDSDASTHKEMEGSTHHKSVGELCQEIRTVTDENFLMCKRACEPAECCFYEDVDCKHIECSAYKFCSVVVAMMGFDDGSISSNSGGANADRVGDDDLQFTFLDDVVLNPILPEQVMEDCTDISTSALRDDCRFSCTDFMCCFDLDYDEITCHKKSVCDKYSVCDILNYNSETYNGDNNIDRLDDACSMENLIESGSEECTRLCEDHMCCFSIENPCVTRPDCQSYGVCGILAENNIAGDSAHDSTKVLVSKKCSQENIKTEKGGQECASLCKPAECCFTGDCAMPDCDDYEGCEDIFLRPSSYTGENSSFDQGNAVSKPPPAKDLHEPWLDCKKTNMSNGDVERCEEACTKWSCCWSSEPRENCAKVQEDECRAASTYCSIR